jgi:hypothetical protein
LIDDEMKELESTVATSDDTLNVIDENEPEIVKVILSDEDKLSYTEMVSLKVLVMPPSSCTHLVLS